jgi:hypothetical protein
MRFRRGPLSSRCGSLLVTIALPTVTLWARLVVATEISVPLEHYQLSNGVRVVPLPEEAT